MLSCFGDINGKNFDFMTSGGELLVRGQDQKLFIKK